MVLVQPTQPRYLVEELPGRLVFTIPSRKNWFAVCFLGFWLMGWLVGEVAVIGILAVGLISVLRGAGPTGIGGWGAGVFLLAWLAMWTAGGVLTIYVWLWQLAGREVISIGGDLLRIERRVPLWRRAREYHVASITALRLSPPTFAPSQSRRFGQSSDTSVGVLAFDYGASTVHFGVDLDEAESKHLLSQIAQRYPHIVEGHEH